MSEIPSPCFVIEMQKLKQNLELMKSVQDQAGVDIILALKGFSTWSTFPLVSQYLKGCTASSVWEAQLAREEFNKEVHAYAPAYKQSDIDALLPLINHISFNSLSQWETYKNQFESTNISCGLRVNPEHQEAETPLYDPSAPGSRLGIRQVELETADLSGIEGFHVHNLCECDSFATERTLAAIDEKFATWLPSLKWLNLGGGHLMTHKDYDVTHLINSLKAFKTKYPNLHIIMEPGSAVAWETGYLLAEVVDVIHNQGDIALLDISATGHMPDVLEMPYRPAVRNSGQPNEKQYSYKLGGNSCLAGDVIGDYSFDQPLAPGDRLIFEDMAHYTMVKTTFFNGVQHPHIGLVNESGSFELVRSFEYQDFKSRLG